MKIFTTLFTLLLISSLTFAQVSEKEKDALLDLYVATDGNNWNTTWDVNTPVSDWHGVVVDDNRVVGLNLMFNNLQGYLPATIGQLEHIENMELSFNQINGALPSILGTLVNLKSFAINSNRIEGAIPSSLGNLVNLEELHLSSNLLSGVIPATLGALDNLKTFNVFDNSLSGTIPYGLTKSNKLKQLVVAENDIIVTDALADVLLFEVDNENTRFKTPSTFVNKTVLAIETSDDDK